MPQEPGTTGLTGDDTWEAGLQVCPTSISHAMECSTLRALPHFGHAIALANLSVQALAGSQSELRVEGSSAREENANA